MPPDLRVAFASFRAVVSIRVARVDACDSTSSAGWMPPISSISCSHVSCLEVIKTPRSERMIRIHSAEISKDRFRVSAFESNFVCRRGSGRGF